MKRGVFGLLLLIVFLGLGLWGSFGMAKVHQPLSQMLESAAETALSGDLDTAATAAKEVQAEWERHWNRVAVLADHTPMDNIDGMFAQLEVFAQAGNHQHFAACCKELASMISATAEAHRLTLWNIFSVCR